MIDTVHRFYETLGIRGEKDIPPVILFRERLIHTTVVAAVQHHSGKLANGLLDPNDGGFLDVGKLYLLLLPNPTISHPDT